MSINFSLFSGVKGGTDSYIPESAPSGVTTSIEKRHNPDEADFLYGYATPPEYLAYMHSDSSKGSRFFSRLTEYLDRYANV